MGPIPREPTGDECSGRTAVFQTETHVGYATWYPQMGGYHGKAVVVLDRKHPTGCFDVYVWHDGAFPFNGDRSPACLHHCDAEQFIEFGQQVIELQERRPTAGPSTAP